MIRMMSNKQRKANARFYGVNALGFMVFGCMFAWLLIGVAETMPQVWLAISGSVMSFGMTIALLRVSAKYD